MKQANVKQANVKKTGGKSPVWMDVAGDGTVLIHLAIQPGARKSGLCGVHGDRLKLKVASPPVDGKANDSVVEFFAEFFDVAMRNVTIVRGQTSRQKTVAITALDLDEFSLGQLMERLSSFVIPIGPTQSS